MLQFNKTIITIQLHTTDRVPTTEDINHGKKNNFHPTKIIVAMYKTRLHIFQAPRSLLPLKPPQNQALYQYSAEFTSVFQ